MIDKVDRRYPKIIGRFLSLTHILLLSESSAALTVIFFLFLSFLSFPHLSFFCHTIENWTLFMACCVDYIRITEPPPPTFLRICYVESSNSNSNFLSHFCFSFSRNRWRLFGRNSGTLLERVWHGCDKVCRQAMECTKGERCSHGEVLVHKFQQHIAGFRTN